MPRTETTPRHLTALLAAAAGAAALMLALPAAGQAAKVSFGAKLNAGGFAPEAQPVPCKWDASESCTRLPDFYSEPHAIGFKAYAPKDGVIKRIRLISANKGRMRIQLGEVSGNGVKSGRVFRNGPVIKFEGTGAIEIFKVNVPVQKFEVLGFRSKRAKAINCSQVGGVGSSPQFDPPLVPANPFQVTSWAEDCTHLINARIDY